MHDKQGLVAKLPLFKNLMSEEIDIIAQSIQEEDLSKGEIFIQQEGSSDAAYFIVNGSVRVFRVTEDGEEVTLAILGSGEVVGELALLDDQPRSANVEAISDTKVYILTREDFSKILSSYPRTALGLLKTLAERVRSINERLEDILSKNLSERTLKTLETLAPHFPDRSITLSQEELATIVGATRARVTEALDHLQKQGKVTLSHRKIQLN